MSLEIEKKYRLNPVQREQLLRRLREAGAASCGEEFEENTLYSGPAIDARRSVLRLRRVEDKAILAYKESHESDSSIKHQREDETQVADPAALESILNALGYKPSLVYEKRRATWRIEGVEVVVDELPFGLFAEIEGPEPAILEVEQTLGLDGTEAELATYPELTARHGEQRGDIIEARFQLSLPEM